MQRNLIFAIALIAALWFIGFNTIESWATLFAWCVVSTVIAALVGLYDSFAWKATTSGRIARGIGRVTPWAVVIAYAAVVVLLIR